VPQGDDGGPSARAVAFRAANVLAVDRAVRCRRVAPLMGPYGDIEEDAGGERRGQYPPEPRGVAEDFGDRHPRSGGEQEYGDAEAVPPYIAQRPESLTHIPAHAREYGRAGFRRQRPCFSPCRAGCPPIGESTVGQ